MSYMPLENLENKASGIFKLVLAASERANALNEGKEPLVKSTSNKATTVALTEIMQGLIRIQDAPGKKTKRQ